MKTRKQKVICRVLCMVVSILLLASFFVVQVSAEVDQLSTVILKNELYSYEADGGGDNPDSSDRPFPSLRFHNASKSAPFSVLNNLTSFDFKWPSDVYTGRNYMYFEFDKEFLDLPSNYSAYYVYYINQLFDDGVVRSFSEGDTCFISPGTFDAIPDDDCYFTSYRFVLREDGDSYGFDYGKVVASTKSYSIDVGSDDDGIVYDDRLALNFTSDVKSNTLCLCLELKVESFEDFFTFNVWQNSVEVSWGPGVSPNYPIYPSAPGGSDVGDYGSAEQEVIQSQEQGITEGLDSISNAENVLTDLDVNFKLDTFSVTLINIMNRIGNVPGFDSLVHISLSLGLIASFLSLTGAIISAADRKAGQAQREAQREARRSRKK